MGAQLVGLRRDELRIEAENRERLVRFVALGGALNEHLNSDLELARLRVTSHIVGLYSGDYPTIRDGVDQLADQYFFAFGRLNEMVREVDALRLTIVQVPTVTDPLDVDQLRTSISVAFRAISNRETYLSTQRARLEVHQLVADMHRITAPDGLLDQQANLITHRAAGEAAGDNLAQLVAALSERIKQTRTSVETESLRLVEQNDQISKQLFLMLLGIVFLSSLAAITLWVRVRTQLVARLGEVSRHIISVARGEYGTPLPITGNDEIGRLEKALNVLRRRAQDAQRLRDGLEDAVIARTSDVVAQMKLSDAARAEAERVNTSKTEFLARMSHEIRTPLSGMIGMLDLLRHEVNDPPSQARVETALSSARELLEIANDILDYASSDDPQNRGNPVHFRLRDLAGRLGHQLTSLTNQKGLVGQVDLNAAPPEALFGDVVKIRQIVGNLLSNAVKYTDEGSVILAIDTALDAESGDLAVSFAVSDTGIGMTQDAVTQAFNPYGRADEVRRSGLSGVGLGLAISRNLTEALGGALNVETAPGVGSRFTLTVPLILGDETKIDRIDHRAPQGSNGQVVMVIDDHATNRSVARGYLQRLGCTVLEAADGQSALSALDQNTIDVALIDLDLPDMPGTELAQHISKKQPDARLVLLTAHLIDDTAEERTARGVSLILSKPISPRALSDLLVADRAPPPLENHYDNALSPLISLRQDVDDIGAEVTAQIVGEFLAGLDDAVAAIVQSDPKETAKYAHRLKGAALNFQLTQLCAALKDIEQAGGQKRQPLIDTLAETVQDAANQLQAASAELGLSID